MKKKKKYNLSKSDKLSWIFLNILSSELACDEKEKSLNKWSHEAKAMQ